jgi:hypothetical protein
MSVHKLNFIEAARIAPNPVSPDTIKSKAPREVLKIFHAGITQVLGTLVLPGFAFGTGVKWGGITNKHIHEHFNNRTFTQGELSKMPIEVWNKIEREMATAMRLSDNDVKIQLEGMTRQLETFVERSGENIHAPVHNLLRSLVILVWVSLETLSEDLLVASIREHPECFSLTGREEWKFRSRRAIRKSYLTAFSTDNFDIKALISSESIDATSLLRNVLVHKAGFADDEFLNEGRKLALLTPFHTLHATQAIELNGQIVESILSPAIQCGYDLVVAVDKWIVTHKP